MDFLGCDGCCRFFFVLLLFDPNRTGSQSVASTTSAWTEGGISCRSASTAACCFLFFDILARRKIIKGLIYVYIISVEFMVDFMLDLRFCVGLMVDF